MPDIDELLQQKLQALEKGSPLSDVLMGLEDDNGELASLVQLAQSIRSVPHPVPVSERALAEQKKVMAAARQLSRKPAPKHSADWGWLRGRWAPVYAAVALAVCLFVVVFGGGVWMSRSKSVPAVTLAYVDGQVEMLPADSTEGWRSISAGDQVSEGALIRTHAGASAILEYFDGSLSSIGSSTELTLLTARQGQGKALQVQLVQSVGSTDHYVQKLNGENGFFVVQTPAGNASVHGTRFSVSVAPGGMARFAVDTGEVVVSNAETDVTLADGQATLSQPGQPPAEPAYQFTLNDEINETQDNQWNAAGVPFTLVDPQDPPQTGQFARVTGRVLPNGSLVADQIETTQQAEPQRSFTGRLEKMIGATWKVGGIDVQVDDSTTLGENISLGSPLRVDFAVQEDGTWLALHLENLETLAGFSLPPITAPDPNARPNLSFEPDEIELAACGSDFDFTGTLVNTADEPEDYAANVLLGYSIHKGAEYVDWIELTPPGWEVIQAGERVDFNIHLTLKPSWSTVPDGTQVTIRLFIAQETNRPGNHRTRLTVTLSASCKGTPSPTPSPTGTLTPTATGTVTPTPTVTTTGTGEFVDCMGADPHPTGTTLAEKYGVSYQEIMGWFCQGFGFGEIDLAYGWRDEYHIPVTDIFNMRLSGMGWGQIKQELEGKAHPPKPTRKPTHTPKPSKKP